MYFDKRGQFKKYSAISKETDRNHECQLRKSLREILLINIWLIINATEKKIHVILHMQYMYCIFGLLCGNCLNFLLWMMIFRNYNLQCLRKDFN